FGFYDKVNDIPKTGNVSYVVIGWYSLPEHDPLFTSDDRPGLLKYWKLAHHDRTNAYVDRATLTSARVAATKPPWTSDKIVVTEKPKLRVEQLQDVARSQQRGGTPASRSKQLERMQRGFPAPPVSAGAPIQSVVQAVAHESGPKEILCHGSVVEVPLS